MCRQCEITSELQAWGQALLRSYELTADGRSRRQAWAILQEEALEAQRAARAGILQEDLVREMEEEEAKAVAVMAALTGEEPSPEERAAARKIAEDVFAEVYARAWPNPSPS